MRRLLVCVLMVAGSLVLGGCSADWERRGGFADAVADNAWRRAESKGFRLIRAYMMQVALARAATLSPTRADDRDIIAQRLIHANDRANEVLACIFGYHGQDYIIAPAKPEDLPQYARGYSLDPLSVPIRNPCFYFDSLMDAYANSLFNLARTALEGREQQRLFRRFETAYRGGLPAFRRGLGEAGLVGGLNAVQAALNIGDLLDAFFDLVVDAFYAGRVFGAVYRDMVEFETQIWLDTLPAGAGARLREAYLANNDNMRAWEDAMRALRDVRGEPVPQVRHYAQLAAFQGDICQQITANFQAGFACARPPALLLPACFIPTTITTTRSVSVNGQPAPAEQSVSVTVFRLRPECVSLQPAVAAVRVRN